MMLGHMTTMMGYMTIMVGHMTMMIRIVRKSLKVPLSNVGKKCEEVMKCERYPKIMMMDPHNPKSSGVGFKLPEGLARMTMRSGP